MAAASCSSACIPRHGLLGCARDPRAERSRPRPRLKPCAGGQVFRTTPNGIATSQLPYQNHLCLPRIQYLYLRETVCILPRGKRKGLDFAWKTGTQIPKTCKFQGCGPGNKHTSTIKAVATVVQKCFAPSEISHVFDNSMQFNSTIESQVSHTLNDDSPEMDERERLRRIRISKANKGNIPWNKGRKHSAETLQRIRERTRIAMQDPKIRMKLANLGHAQSEETRIKIGIGVREGWQRRREMLMLQESCLFEWQNLIAEASRKGYSGEAELQWDSYDVLDEKLKQEWLESIEKRRSTPRPKGSKRAPKSLEQRRKISEAISAKWADPEYRERVCSALSKYHGKPIGAERQPRRKPTGESSPNKRKISKKESAEIKGIKSDPCITKKPEIKKKKYSTPLYKDPLSSSKLEIIKKIRAERATVETRKREAVERAKLLIAEAEKAAKALETAALKSPLAQASLLETRKLIAEARLSIERIDSGIPLSDDGDGTSFTSSGLINHVHSSPKAASERPCLDEPLVNGNHLWNHTKNFDLNTLTVKHELDTRVPMNTARSEENTDIISVYHSPLSQSNNISEQPAKTDLQVGPSQINGSAIIGKEVEESLAIKKDDSGRTPTTKIKKWVRGKLVEVEED